MAVREPPLRVSEPLQWGRVTNTIVDELARIPMSPFLAATLSRAAGYADAQGHLQVTIEHLLLSLTEDPEATIVLKASNVDVGRLAADVSAQLGRIEERATEGTQRDVILSTDLKRILEAAAVAASQGKRREINGAIVLAAIVGEGRSTSAHMLRAQGMTFEEAIRALQRSQAAAAQPAPGAPSADEILASARERVQSRSQAGQPRLPHYPQAPNGEAREPGTQNYADAVPADDVIDTSPASPVAAPAPAAFEPKWEPAPVAEAVRNEPRPYYAEEQVSAPVPPLATPSAAPPQQWAPPPAPAPSGQPRGAPPRMPPPLPANVTPPRAPVPGGGSFGAAAGYPPPPGSPTQMYRAQPQNAQAPWSEAGDHNARAPQRPNPSAPSDPRRRMQAPIVQAGQLAENIPRRMRVAVPMVVEARIARAEVKAIADTMQGGGTIHRHEVMVSKAMTVRLRTPDGGFFVETASPETQWIDNVLGVMADDYASWRWTITAKARGKRRLQLVVSARTVGADGLMAETALPDQVIEVKVGINYAKSAASWAGWVTAASIGGILARFGEDAYMLGRDLVARVFGS